MNFSSMPINNELLVDTTINNELLVDDINNELSLDRK